MGRLDRLDRFRTFRVDPHVILHKLIALEEFQQGQRWVKHYQIMVHLSEKGSLGVQALWFQQVASDNLIVVGVWVVNCVLSL